jgi:hypothetical protein
MITAKHRQIAPGHVRVRKEAAMKLHVVLFTTILAGAIGGFAILDTEFPPNSVLSQDTAGQTTEADTCLGPVCGVWEGTWHGGLPSRLVIAHASGNTATVFHAWGDHPRGPLKAGWEQARAKILPDGSLHWGYPGKFSLRPTADGQALDGEYAWGGQIARITLRQVS